MQTPITVGVLALQGGFAEHIALLHRAAAASSTPISAVPVRTAAQLSRCDALVIPGGESTAMSLVAADGGLVEPLREFVLVQKKPTWGTCAGLILLAREATIPNDAATTTATRRHQVLLGGLNVRVRRNHFGRQAQSFVAPLHLDFLPDNTTTTTQTAPFEAVFIRAPVVEKILTPSSTAKNPVVVLATIPSRNNDTDTDIVAVRQGNVVGTSFHPELTSDPRIHAWFLDSIVRPFVSSSSSSSASALNLVQTTEKELLVR